MYCDACRVADEKDLIDWCHREEELLRLSDKYRGKQNHTIASYPEAVAKIVFLLLILKEKYGMSPLLVTWQPIPIQNMV